MSIILSRIMCIGDRLREERERLKFDQESFAIIGGASRRSQSDWENDKSFPNAKYLSAIAAVGADVQYILTGIRSNQAAEQNPGYTVLNREEAALIDNFRHIADQEDKSAVTKLALRSAEAATREETQPRMKKKSG